MPDQSTDYLGGKAKREKKAIDLDLIIVCLFVNDFFEEKDEKLMPH